MLNAYVSDEWNNSWDVNTRSTRYTRLALLACMDTICTVPLSTLVIILNVKVEEIVPYPGWTAVHKNFNYIPTIRVDEWSMSPISMVFLWFDYYVYAFCALVTFAFFGWGEEARRGYKNLWLRIRAGLGLKVKDAKDDIEVIVFAEGPTQAVNENRNGDTRISPR